MKVKLLAHTPNPEMIIATAGRGCYSDKPASEISFKSIDQMCKQMDIIHGSVLEHVSFTFSIEGVSRVLTHQLVRHRIASFSQQSMRYVDVHKLWKKVVVPKRIQTILEDEDALFKEACALGTLNSKDYEKGFSDYYHDYMVALQFLIQKMDEMGIPSEDQRYFVPNGVMTNIVVTMNLRELQHFFGLRRCKRAQWEIREMADKMAELIESECPVLTNHVNLGPQCEQFGKCPEHKSCGKHATEEVKKVLDEPRVPIILSEPPECHYCGNCDTKKTIDFVLENTQVPSAVLDSDISKEEKE